MALDLAEIHQQMLDGIGERYQKTTGFPAYDFTRAFAIAVLSLDSDIAVAEEKLDLENLSEQSWTRSSGSTEAFPENTPPMPQPPYGWSPAVETSRRGTCSPRRPA